MSERLLKEAKALGSANYIEIPREKRLEGYSFEHGTTRYLDRQFTAPLEVKLRKPFTLAQLREAAAKLGLEHSTITGELPIHEAAGYVGGDHKLPANAARDLSIRTRDHYWTAIFRNVHTATGKPANLTLQIQHDPGAGGVSFDGLHKEERDKLIALFKALK